MRILQISKNSLSSPGAVAALVACLYSLHAIWMHRDVYFSGQMFNEAATNYFFNAKTLGLSSLFQTDAGYWPLLLRLVSFLIEGLPLTLDQVPFAYAAVAFLGPLLLVLPFVSLNFAVVVSGTWTRGLICLLLLLTMDWETRQYINWTNLASFTLFYIVVRAISKRNIDNKSIPWLLLLLATKPVVMPMGLLLAFAYWRSSKNWSKLGSIIVLLWLGVAIFFMLLAQSESPVPRSTDFVEIGLLPILYTLKFFGAAIVAPLQFQIHFVLQIFLGLSFLVFTGLYFRARLNSWTFLVGAFLALMNLLVLVVGMPIPWNFDYLDQNKVWFFRQFTPFWVSFFMMLIPMAKDLVSRLARKAPVAYLGMSLLVAAAVIVSLVVKPLADINPLLRKGSTSEIGLNDWRANSEPGGVVDRSIDGLACTAVNPFLTPFGKGCVASPMSKFQSGDMSTNGYSFSRKKPVRISGVYLASTDPEPLEVFIEIDGKEVTAEVQRVSIPGDMVIWKIKTGQIMASRLALKIAIADHIDTYTPVVLHQVHGVPLD